MVGYYYKTGAEIYSILRFMKNSLNLPYEPSASSIEVVKMYADKKYRFSFFLNDRKKIIYLIEQLGDDTTDYSKEEKKMNIYAFMNSIPDNVSNPLTAINVMIMISSLKDKFGDKLYETTRKGYLTTQDMIPCKYYKLYLWYWCDACTYGIRECTVKDFNIKEEEKMDISKMTKEDALKAIENLKAYVEKCEEKEKEIPRMHRGILQKAQPTIVCPWMKNEGLPLWWKDVTGWTTFNEDDTFLTWGILAYELAQLMYCREYLKVDGEKLLRARKHDDMVFKVIFVINEGRYETVDIFGSQVLNENDRIWCFTNEDDANRVRNYMNKYVAHVKKNMF